jgi:eukaryotic-like serine/threonine-protein kinase
VTLRTATGARLDGSTVVAAAAQEGGQAVLTLDQPLEADSLLVWFTKVPQQSSGEYRVIVSEISIS